MKTDIEEVSEPQPSSKQVEAEFGDAVFLEPTDPVEEWPVDDGVPKAYLDKEVPQNPKDSGPISGDFFDTTKQGEWHATVIGQTPGGKNVQVMKKRDGAGYEIAFNPGGELPRDLQGVWTTYDRAEKQVRLWLNEQYAKASNAEAVA